MNQHDKTRFDALREWSQRHGAELHPSLEIYRDHVSGYSLRVKPDLTEPVDPGFRAVTCPVSTTLSFLNALVDGPLDVSSVSQLQNPAFPSRFMQSVPPHVIGRFFLIKEYLKGAQSFWWPYIATVPAPDQVSAWALPPFWPDDDAAYLSGTNAHVAIAEIQAHIKHEFKQARKLLKEEEFPNYTDYSQLLYKWAYSIFTSRSFRPSLILSDPTKRHVSSLLPEGCQLDDFSILQPLFDIANHSMTARYTWDTTSNPATCQLICHDSYQPGDQVYNNYGLKTNSELLLAYGFTLPASPALHNDYVHVRKRQQDGPGPDASADHQPPKPNDFLISLRPVSHPSSLVAHSRLPTHPTPHARLAALPCFAHLEPALVEDLASAVASPSEREALRARDAADGDPGGGATLPSELGELVDRVKGLLMGKLGFDLQRLRAVRVGGGENEGGEGEEEEEEEEVEEELPPPGNKNQVLAAGYRMQCEKVLVAALEGLVGEDSGGAGGS